jgi:hypothetical protein
MVNNAKNLLSIIEPYIDTYEFNLDRLNEDEIEQLAFDIKMCISKSIVANVYSSNK